MNQFEGMSRAELDSMGSSLLRKSIGKAIVLLIPMAPILPFFAVLTLSARFCQGLSRVLSNLGYLIGTVWKRRLENVEEKYLGAVNYLTFGAFFRLRESLQEDEKTRKELRIAANDEMDFGSQKHHREKGD